MARYATVVGVASDSSDATYRVYVGEDGVPVFCDCNGFRLRKGPVEERKPCKHMRRLGADPVATRAASVVAQTVAAGNRVPGGPGATSVIGRFNFIEVVEQTTDGLWAPVAGARFDNLEVD